MTKSPSAGAITRTDSASYATCVEYSRFLRAHRVTPKLSAAREIPFELVGIIQEGRA